MLPALSGCAVPLPNYREVDRMLVIQTMGLDDNKGGVLLSLASAADSSGGQPPRRLFAAGDSITGAMERIFNYSYEDELFCYHVNHVLIGEAAAEAGIESYLSYICRSPSMRIDVPLFVVRGGRAADAVNDIGDGGRGVSEILESIRDKLDRRGGGRVFSTADVLLSLRRYGSALICALDCGDASQTDSQTKAEGEGGAQAGGEDKASAQEESGGETGGKTASVFGYAVIREGRLCKFIEPQDALAVDFLLGDVGICDVEVRDKQGSPAVLEIDDGDARVTPVWSAPGTLGGLDIRANVSASVLETAGSDSAGSAEYTDYLTAQLEALISQRIQNVLQISRDLRSDFLGLAGQVERQSPDYYRLMSASFPDCLPELELSVTISGTLTNTNDMKSP